MDNPAELPDHYRTDCPRCVGLCCIASAHLPANGFPETKQANQRCRNLTDDNRCRVFETLEAEGYLVCRAYDCFGAGPTVTRWIERDGTPMPSSQRLEDFRQLSRLHMLVTAVRGQDEKTIAPLVAAGNEVSLAYKLNGIFNPTSQFVSMLKYYKDIVDALLREK